MRLGNLVNTKIKIKEVDAAELLESVDAYVTSLIKVISSSDIQDLGVIESLKLEVGALTNTVDKINTILSEYKDKLQTEINKKTENWNRRGYSVESGYLATNFLPNDMERSNRSVMVPDKIKQEVLSQIQRHTLPKFPCLEIGPGDGDWTHHLVAGDPLYLVDIQDEFLNITVSKFPQQYQRRLRRYRLEMDNCFDLSPLPQNQFGFIFSWNVFDYFPETETREYLTSCFNVLRPGGVMVFSYNNCNTVMGANYAEIGNKSWMTEELLISICENIGFEIDLNKAEDSWIVIKKPGTLRSVKTHQALGEIINQNS